MKKKILTLTLLLSSFAIQAQVSNAMEKPLTSAQKMKAMMEESKKSSIPQGNIQPLPPLVVQQPTPQPLAPLVVQQPTPQPLILPVSYGPVIPQGNFQPLPPFVVQQPTPQPLAPLVVQPNPQLFKLPVSYGPVQSVVPTINNSPFGPLNDKTDHLVLIKAALLKAQKGTTVVRSNRPDLAQNVFDMQGQKLFAEIDQCNVKQCIELTKIILVDWNFASYFEAMEAEQLRLLVEDLEPTLAHITNTPEYPNFKNMISEGKKLLDLLSYEQTQGLMRELIASLQSGF